MDTLDPIYSSFPTYRLLDETMRGELRVLLAREARRWVEEDVPAGRTAKSPLGARTAPWPTTLRALKFLCTRTLKQSWAGDSVRRK